MPHPTLTLSIFNIFNTDVFVLTNNNDVESIRRHRIIRSAPISCCDVQSDHIQIALATT